MANSNVLYYEPNWTHSVMSEDDGGKVIELAPSLEDYCIVLDLEVEVPSRPIEGKVKSDSSTILLRYASKKGSKGSVSFMEGKKGVNDSYLSTDAMEYGTFTDIEQISGTTTNEMFGINSVNIEYANYQVPIVTIEFTDIRGMSLFAVEEFRHNQTTNGLPYTQNTDLTGSFFKSFFTFPHPKFKLTVKGFYGQPVAYDLYCSDFRANFNATTGNFGATAKFVGHSFSIMNDLTLTSLLVSPYSEYYGASYWESKIANETFILDNGTPMPKLIELVNKYGEISEALKKVNENNELKKLQDEQNKINLVIQKISEYTKKLYDTIESTPKYYLDAEGGTKVIISGDYTNEIQQLTESQGCNNEFNDAKQALKDYDEKLIPLLIPYSSCRKDNVFCQDRGDNVSYSYNLDDNAISGITNFKYVYEFNCIDLFTTLSTASVKVANAIVKKEEDISNASKNTVQDILGFKPTVENITNIILAHVDTFLHELYHCADSVSEHIATDRTVNSFRTENDIKTYGETSDIMYAFPEVAKQTQKDGVTKLEKSWIGIKDSEAPEAKLVESLLKAAFQITQDISDVSKTIDEVESNGLVDYGLCQGVVHPITPFDVLGHSAPYGNTDVSNISNLVGNIFLRVSSILTCYKDSSRSTKLKNLMSRIGEVDALNFYKNVSITSLDNEFVTKASENGLYTKLNYHFNSLLMGDSDAWKEFGVHFEEGDTLVWERDGVKSLCERENTSWVKNPIPFFYDGDNMTQVYPLCGIDWKTFNPSLVDKQNENVMTSTFNSKNWIKLETDWEKYNFYTANRKPSKYQEVDELTNCAFDASSFSAYFDRVLENSDIRRDNVKIEKSSVFIKDIETSLNSNPTCTIASFNGYTNKNITSDISLFAQPEYYASSMTLDGQALLFLNSFNWEIKDFITNFHRNNFVYMPYYYVLTIGGYLKRKKYGHKQMFPVNFKNINEAEDELLDNRGWLWYQDNLGEGICGLNDGIKDALIALFDEWVVDSFQKDILNVFNIDPQTCVKIQKATTNEDASKILDTKYHPSDRKPYSGILKGGKLLNKAGDVEYVTKQLLKPILVIRGTDYYAIDDKCYFTFSSFYQYVSGFMQGIRDNLPQQIEEEKSTVVENEVIAFRTKEELKVSLYYYLKRIWDKWLSGSGVETDGNIQWEYNKFKEHWHYLDSYFNKVGHINQINISDFIKDVTNAYHVAGYSSLSLISTTYAKSGFNLISTQSFLSMITDEKMKDIFKPIPYKEIDFSNISSTPDFVVMYIYEPSSKLASIDESTMGDSYFIGGDDLQLPEAIKTKNLTSGYRIPAFGVTVGKQYQSYFSNVDVSMENPQVTEQSLNAQFQIADLAQGGQEWTVVGSDLFTVYSNNSYTCTVTMMGCAWIQPLMNFQLNNVPMFKGTYLIQKVSHSISQGQMTTTFTGTRMANIASPIIEDGLIVSNNLQSGNQGMRIFNPGSYAAINNDCKYNYYNPLLEANDVGMSTEELHMSMFDYGVKYGGWKLTDAYCPSDEWQKKHTVLDFLACVLIGEASVMDELGRKQVCAVIFNRYKAMGDLVHVFRNNVQHETRRWSDYQDKTIPQTYVDIVEEIFTQTPIVLVGTETTVKRQVPIWNNMLNTYRQTDNTIIDEHMVKSMTAYATTMGYDSSYKNPRHLHNVGENYEPLEPIPFSDASKTWHGGEYLFQHDYKGDENKARGHVFVSTNLNSSVKAGQELWTINEVRNTYSEDVNPSQYCQRLFESIQKTCKDSHNITLSNLQMKISKKKDPNAMEITCTPLSGMAQVFDVILNTYALHVDELYWVVEDGGGDYPSYIQVKVNEGADNKKIAIAKTDMTKSNGVCVLNQYDDLNDLFYVSLAKRYGLLSKTNNTMFTLECLNFSDLISKGPNDGTAHWTDTVNGYFTKQALNKCGVFNVDDEVNSVNRDVENTDSIFTWKGDDVASNKTNPTYIDAPYNVDEVVKYLKINCLAKTQGACAKSVRLGLEAGGLVVEPHQPNSACRYVAHLPYWGFKKVYSNVIGGKYDFIAQKGDIAVIAGVIDGNEQHLHGHIHVYGEDGWYSDFKANTVSCYGSPQGRPYMIFRHNSLLQA